jgi:hypothetical protein
VEDDELEPEVLTYSEFQRRCTLVAWQERRRLYESSQPTKNETFIGAGLWWLRQNASRLGGSDVVPGSTRTHFRRLG